MSFSMIRAAAMKLPNAPIVQALKQSVTGLNSRFISTQASKPAEKVAAVSKEELIKQLDEVLINHKAAVEAHEKLVLELKIKIGPPDLKDLKNGATFFGLVIGGTLGVCKSIDYLAGYNASRSHGFANDDD